MKPSILPCIGSGTQKSQGASRLLFSLHSDPGSWSDSERSLYIGTWTWMSEVPKEAKCKSSHIAFPIFKLCGSWKNSELSPYSGTQKSEASS